MFVAVDDLLRPLYPHLTAADQCYFLREYTAGRGYAGSETNRLILNLKKPPDRRGKPEWRYKQRAIEQVAREFRASVNLSALRRVTLVPMPPSKAKDDPLYDDRMLQVLRAVDVEGQLDIRELLLGAASMPAAHLTTHRPTIAQLIANFVIDEALTEPGPRPSHSSTTCSRPARISSRRRLCLRRGSPVFPSVGSSSLGGCTTSPRSSNALRLRPAPIRACSGGAEFVP